MNYEPGDLVEHGIVFFPVYAKNAIPNATAAAANT